MEIYLKINAHQVIVFGIKRHLNHLWFLVGNQIHKYKLDMEIFIIQKYQPLSEFFSLLEIKILVYNKLYQV